MQRRPSRELLRTRRKSRTVKTGKMPRVFERRLWRDLDNCRKRKADEGESEGKRKKKRSSGSDTRNFFREKMSRYGKCKNRGLS